MSTERPLEGKRIVVTRARSQASSLVTALRELGAEVIEIPTIEIVALESYELLDAALRGITQYQWLIVTSANTVRVLAERMATLGLSISTLTALRKAAVGSATADALRESGIAVDVVPERYIAESLVADLGERLSGSHVLLARASVARDVIPDELRRGGAIVDVIDAYKTVIPAGAVERVRQVFLDTSRLPDAVTFTSSSTVKNFFTLFQSAGFAGVPAGVAFLSIGPVTTRTLREYGWEPAVEAEPHDVAGLLTAVTSQLGSSV